MAARGYPNFVDQPGALLAVFNITGSAVATTSSSAGLDGRGQAIANIKDNGSNVQTVTFKQKYADTPYVIIQALSANGAANIAVTDETIVLTGVRRDSNSVAISDQNFTVFVYSHNTTQYIL